MLLWIYRSDRYQLIMKTFICLGNRSLVWPAFFHYWRNLAERLDVLPWAVVLIDGLLPIACTGGSHNAQTSAHTSMLVVSAREENACALVKITFETRHDPCTYNKPL